MYTIFIKNEHFYMLKGMTNTLPVSNRIVLKESIKSCAIGFLIKVNKICKYSDNYNMITLIVSTVGSC